MFFHLMIMVVSVGYFVNGVLLLRLQFPGVDGVRFSGLLIFLVSFCEL